MEHGGCSHSDNIFEKLGKRKTGDVRLTFCCFVNKIKEKFSKNVMFSLQNKT